MHTHRTGWQALGQLRHQRLHPLPKRHKQAVTGTTGAIGRLALLPRHTLVMQQGPDQAPMLPFHGHELWYRGLHAEQLRISGVNTADHGLRYALQGLMPQAARDEVR
jgi:hypothetical protein